MFEKNGDGKVIVTDTSAALTMSGEEKPMLHAFELQLGNAATPLQVQKLFPVSGKSVVVASNASSDLGSNHDTLHWVSWSQDKELAIHELNFELGVHSLSSAGTERDGEALQFRLDACHRVDIDSSGGKALYFIGRHYDIDGIDTPCEFFLGDLTDDVSFEEGMLAPHPLNNVSPSLMLGSDKTIQFVKSIYNGGTVVTLYNVSGSEIGNNEAPVLRVTDLQRNTLKVTLLLSFSSFMLCVRSRFPTAATIVYLLLACSSAERPSRRRKW
jgi:hypothetical protein